MRIYLLLPLLALSAIDGIQGQTPSCQPTAVPPIVRAEGLSERLGDIILACTGGAPNGTLQGNLNVILNVSVANRITSANNLDVILTADSGAGPVQVTTPATVFMPGSIAFNGLNIPLSPTGSVTLRLTNIRGSIANQGVTANQPVKARLAFNPGTAAGLPFNDFVVGVPSIGLLASASSTSVVCTGSPLPSTLDLPSLFAAGTRFFSTRVTEGTPEAFERRQAMTDSGVRVMLRYSGFPQGARLFVPDAIAGSSAIQPTAAGDLGVLQAGGTYQQTTAGSLLLVRVRNTDSAGAGGTLVFTPGATTSPVTFSAVGEVDLAGGAGVAVFEVVDADRITLESAQIPTFLGLDRFTGGNAVVAQSRVSLAPLSTVATTSASAPIPRFVDVPPPGDCTALRDCNASYFPRLLVESPLLTTFTGRAGSAFQVRYIRVANEGGSLLNWTANVTYKNGADWIRVDPSSGINNGTIRIDVLPEKLTPGIYEATLTVDAGPFAGSRSLPVRLEVTQLPAPPPQVTVDRITNAASFRTGPLVAGSLATIFGSRLSGAQVEVTFDGVPARILYSAEGQINLQIPASLAGRQVVQMVVTVDGLRSVARTVDLAAVAPAVFAVLNQDYSLNSASNPALAGSVVQIFATGLTSAGATTVTARIHDRAIDTPQYAGDAPGLAGVQQVNLQVPQDLPAMTADVVLCGAPNANPAQRVCSLAFPLHIRR